MFIGKLQGGAAVSRGRRPWKPLTAKVAKTFRWGRKDEVRRLLSRLINFQLDRCLFRQTGIGTGGFTQAHNWGP